MRHSDLDTVHRKFKEKLKKDKPELASSTPPSSNQARLKSPTGSVLNNRTLLHKEVVSNHAANTLALLGVLRCDNRLHSIAHVMSPWQKRKASCSTEL